MMQSKGIPFYLLEIQLPRVSLPRRVCWDDFKVCHEYEMLLTVVILVFQAVLKCHILTALYNPIAYMNRRISLLLLTWRGISLYIRKS